MFPYRSCFAANLLSLRSPACHQWSNRMFHICCHEQRPGRQVGDLKDTSLMMAFSQSEVMCHLISFHSGPALTRGSLRGGAQPLVQPSQALHCTPTVGGGRNLGLRAVSPEMCTRQALLLHFLAYCSRGLPRAFSRIQSPVLENLTRGSLRLSGSVTFLSEKGSCEHTGFCHFSHPLTTDQNLCPGTSSNGS